MAQSYVCTSERRRALLLAQSGGPGNRLDGIDALIVLEELDDPGGAEVRQQVLLVRFLFGDQVGPFSADTVEIRGGVRLVDPRVLWAEPMASLDPSLVQPALSGAAQSWLSTVIANTNAADRDRTLVVFVEHPGDFSTYHLRLVGQGPSFEQDFDIRSMEVDFSFKVECPTPFDCNPRTECDPAPEAPLELDYLARDFISFRQLMIGRLSLLQPHEPSQSPATLRNTLVEALAYAADRAAYHQDAVATEAYLKTARLRRSIRRHARLLDYSMHDGCNARSFVHLELQAGIRVNAASLRRGTTFLTAASDLPRVVSPQAVRRLAPGVLGFQALRDAPILKAAHNRIEIHTWGDEDCCLRAGATSVDLVDDGELELSPGDYLLFEQVRSAITGSEADADLAVRWVVRLSAISDPMQDRLMLGGVQVRRVTWHADDAPVRDVLVVGDPATYLVARANLVLVDHGLPAEEDLVLTVRGHAERVEARLAFAELTCSTPLPADAPSIKRVLHQDPRRALPQVVLTGESTTWTATRDLLSSAPSSTEFVTEMDDEGIAWLRFGDDVLGRRPSLLSVSLSQNRPAGTPAPFVAHYRVGNGPAGNVGAGAVAHIVADPAFVDAAVTAALRGITNPLPAVGGSSPERSDEVQLFAPIAFRTQERAVTAQDWEHVATRHPLVTKATARFRWTGSFTTVFVHVDLAEAAVLSPELHAELTGEFERYRMAGMDVEVRGPIYVPLDIALSVCTEAGFFPEQVEAELVRIFGSGRLRGGAPAFFHPDNFTFGQSIYLSAILARAMKVPGVRWLDATPTPLSAPIQHRFKRLWEPDDGSLVAGRLPVGDLEIARCDSDPNAPENGRIRFFVRSATGGPL